MRVYELTVLLKPDLKDAELDREIKDLQTLLEKNGAKIKSKKDPVKKNLAYEIANPPAGGTREAYYVYFELEAEPDKVGTVDGKLKLEEKVIRYLLVRKE